MHSPTKYLIIGYLSVCSEFIKSRGEGERIAFLERIVKVWVDSLRLKTPVGKMLELKYIII